MLSDVVWSRFLFQKNKGMLAPGNNSICEAIVSNYHVIGPMLCSLWEIATESKTTMSPPSLLLVPARAKFWYLGKGKCIPLSDCVVNGIQSKYLDLSIVLLKKKMSNTGLSGTTINIILNHYSAFNSFLSLKLTFAHYSISLIQMVRYELPKHNI